MKTNSRLIAQTRRGFILMADRHICNWGCHYYRSARVYCVAGYSLAEAMTPLPTAKP